MSGVNNDSTQTDTGPATIEDAFRMLRQNNQQAADPAVGESQLGEGQSDGDGAGEGGEPAGSESVQAQGQEPGADGAGNGGAADGSGEGDDGVGGLAAPIQEPGEPGQIDLSQVDSNEQMIDYNEVGRAYVQSAQNMAIQAVNKLFQDNGVQKVTINDLYEKDDRGRVSFSNPDDPDRPFQSRAEAQSWCDAFNAQVDSEWKRQVQVQTNAYMKDIQPMLRLMDFAPEFDAMTPKQQKVFDQVVEGYAIKDKAGDVIGYSCDLREAKRVALNICNEFGETQGTDVQPADTGTGAAIQGTGPATDAKTSGSSNPQNTNNEPKNLEEAMKMIAEQKKKERKNA